jgi:hypothetical protein
MLKPLTSATAGLFGCLLLLASCDNRREAEAQFLGTWRRINNMDSSFYLTFYPNHTFISSGESLGEYTVFDTGKWYLDYKRIFLRFNNRDENGLLIMNVADVTPQELKISHKDFIEPYERVKTLTREKIQEMVSKHTEQMTKR